MRTTLCLSILLLAAACGGDDGMDAGPDMAAPNDFAVGPELTGTKLTTGANLQLFSVLDDDTVIFSSSVTASGPKSLQAIPAAGGSPTTIDATWSNMVAFTNGVVMVWDGLAMNNVGNLSSWTKAEGLKSLSSAASSNTFPAVSKDGSKVFYSGGGNSDGSLGDLYVSDTAGSAPKLIVSGVPTALSDVSTVADCTPLALFTATKLVVSYCNDAVDAGVRTATVLSVDPATGTSTTLFTDANSDYRFTVDDAGTKVFAIDAMNNAKVIDIGGGSATTIEAGVKNGFVTTDGTAFIYQTMAGALKRVTLAAPTSPTVLVSSNANGLQSPYLSPDGSKVLLYSMETGTDPNPVLRDLFLADITTANQTPVALDSAVETQLYGDAFSADSSHVVFFTNINNGQGTMKTSPVTGGAPTTVATKVWLTAAVRGTKFLYNDMYKGPTSGSSDNAGRADLHLVDLASPATSTLIATQANSGDFFVTKDGSKVVYVYDATPTEAGIYAASIP